MGDIKLSIYHFVDGKLRHFDKCGLFNSAEAREFLETVQDFYFAVETRSTEEGDCVVYEYVPTDLI